MVKNAYPGAKIEEMTCLHLSTKIPYQIIFLIGLSTNEIIRYQRAVFRLNSIVDIEN